MLFPIGRFHHESYGELNFTRARLQQIKQLYDRRVRHIDAALDVDHRAKEDDSRATGWIERLELREAAPDASYPAGLWGEIKWTPYGVSLLRADEYRYFSPEFGPWTDPRTGQEYRDVLMGGALTNRPFLKEMPAIMLAELRLADDGGNVSRRPWGGVNKSTLPRSAFLIQGDPDKKDSWKLPIYEGTGPKDADGCYTQRGPLNINGVRAAYAALHGARSGQSMGVPSSVRARLEALHAKYFGNASKDSSTQDSTAAREATKGSQQMAKRTATAKTRAAVSPTLRTRSAGRDDLDALDRLMALADQRAGAADTDLDDTTDDDDLGDAALALDDSDGGEGDGGDSGDAAMDDGDGEGDGGDSGDAAMDDSGDSDSGDAGDAGYDEDSDRHGAMTTDDHSHGRYGSHSHDGDADHSDAPMKNSGKTDTASMREPRAPHKPSQPLVSLSSARAAKRMTDTEREVMRLREENQQLAYALYEGRVEKQLAQWAAGTFTFMENGKSSPKRGPITLTRALRQSVKAYLLSDALRLSERGRERLIALLELAISNGVVDLSARSAGSYDPDGRMVGARSGSPRYTLDESERVDQEANRLSQAAFNMTTDELAQSSDPKHAAALMDFYTRAQRAVGR